MKILHFILASVMLCSATVHAQPKVYVRSNGQFVANGNEYPRGFWVPTIRDAEEVFTNPIALEAYQKHITYGKWFAALNWGALGAMLTYTIITAGGDDWDGGVALLIFAVPWTAGAFFGLASNQQLIKAINIMNGVPTNEAHFNSLGVKSLLAANTKTDGVKVPLFTYSF